MWYQWEFTFADSVEAKDFDRDESNVTNPYRPTTVGSRSKKLRRYVHRDWWWMTSITFGCCCFPLIVIAGLFRPRQSWPEMIGLRFLPDIIAVDIYVFLLFIPVIAAAPTILVSASFRYYYARISETTRTTEWNYLFLICGIVAAVIQAILFRPVY